MTKSSICLSGTPWYRLTPTAPPVSARLMSETSKAYTATPARRTSQDPRRLRLNRAGRPSATIRSTVAGDPEIQVARTGVSGPSDWGATPRSTRYSNRYRGLST